MAEGGTASDFEGEKGERIQAHADELINRRVEMESVLRQAEAELWATREGDDARPA